MNTIKNNITYRRAEISDANILSEYRVKFLNEVFNIETHPDMIQLKTELIEYFSNSTKDNSLVSWLAEYENRIIATSSLVIWKAPLSYSGLGNKGKRGYILNMYTLKKYRKMGIASTLLDKLIAEAKEMKLEFVNLHATDDGIGVYKSMGFIETKYPELKLKLN